MFQRFRSAAQFRADERGVVLLLVLILMLPLLLLIAVAIDYGQFLVMKRQLTSAVDSAALNVGTTPDISDSDATARANAFVAANYPPSKAIGTLTNLQVVRPDTRTILVTATARLDTTFLKIAGYDSLNVTVSSQAIRKESKLELAMVLDNTGSMASPAGSQSKIQALRASATTLVNILFGPNDTSDYVKIGLVPFTTSVNIKSIGLNPDGTLAWWLDPQGLSPIPASYLDLEPDYKLYDLFGRLEGVSWSGCVRARPGGYDLLDTAPDTNQPNTLFVPYFWPSEPQFYVKDTSGKMVLVKYGLHYIDDAPDNVAADGTPIPPTNWKLVRRGTKKYTTGPKRTPSGGSPNDGCIQNQVVPITNQKTPLLNAINGMVANGSTVIPIGLMWGWHLISPNAPLAQGAPYSDQNTIKAIVLLTDGENAAGTFTAYGFNDDGFLPGNANTALDNKLAQLCNNIKAVQGDPKNPRIIIYSIALGISDNSNSANLLRNCASDSGKYFNTPDAANLNNVFQKIAVGLNQLRIAQ